MYIKNQQFKDEDTLFEVLFDFEIGNPSPYMQNIVDTVTKNVDANAELAEHLKTLDEEDSLELYDDVKREQIVKVLQQNFTAFLVESAAFYGISGNDKSLLYNIDLY